MAVDGGYHRTQMQKNIILQKLKEQGCRITRQRKMLLDIILEDDCSCCKEIYYKALKKDDKIGTATVYRMVNMLEEIGAISRKNMYRISCGHCCSEGKDCIVELMDGKVCQLSDRDWKKVIWEGLKACGYIDEETTEESETPAEAVIRVSLPPPRPDIDGNLI